MKKSMIFGFFLVSALLLLLPGSALAAENSFTFTLSANQTAVQIGDVVTVTMTISNDAAATYKMFAMQDEILYDSSKLALVADSVKPLSGLTVGYRDLADGVSKKILISYVDFSGSGTERAASITAATFQLKALAAGTVSVRNDALVMTNQQVKQLVVNGKDVAITIAGANQSNQTGNTVDTGNTGNTGDTGNTGNTGDTGNTGNTGGTGNTGNTGDTGNTGNTGDTGNNDKVQFADVPTSHWAAEWIYDLAQRGLINGKTTTTFAPADSITRAEFLAILARISGDTLPAYGGGFSDVKSSDWFAASVAWGVQQGVIKGVSDQLFAANNQISRQDMAVILVRFAEARQINLTGVNPPTVFTDDAAIAAYAKAAVQTMQKAGILNGKENGRFAPLNFATRAEAAKMLDMMVLLIEK